MKAHGGGRIKKLLSTIRVDEKDTLTKILVLKLLKHSALHQNQMDPKQMKTKSRGSFFHVTVTLPDGRRRRRHTPLPPFGFFPLTFTTIPEVQSCFGLSPENVQRRICPP